MEREFPPGEIRKAVEAAFLSWMETRGAKPPHGTGNKKHAQAVADLTLANLIQGKAAE